MQLWSKKTAFYNVANVFLKYDILTWRHVTLSGTINVRLIIESDGFLIITYFILPKRQFNNESKYLELSDITWKPTKGYFRQVKIPIRKSDQVHPCSLRSYGELSAFFKSSDIQQIRFWTKVIVNNKQMEVHILTVYYTRHVLQKPPTNSSFDPRHSKTDILSYVESYQLIQIIRYPTYTVLMIVIVNTKQMEVHILTVYYTRHVLQKPPTNWTFDPRHSKTDL